MTWPVDWWPKLLLFVFATHAPFFAWRYYRTRELRYAATAITFALLTLAYTARLLEPAAFPYLRVVGWGSAVVSVGLLLRHHARRLQGTSRPG